MSQCAYFQLLPSYASLEKSLLSLDPGYLLHETGP